MPSRPQSGQPGLGAVSRGRRRRGEGRQREQGVEDQDPSPGRADDETVAPAAAQPPRERSSWSTSTTAQRPTPEGRPSGPHAADKTRESPPSKSAAEVIGISGIFKMIPIGETRWNRSATSGTAASQTTVEATTPSTTRSLPPGAIAVRHQGSKRRSRSSSADRRTEEPALDRLKNLPRPAHTRATPARRARRSPGTRAGSRHRRDTSD